VFGAWVLAGALAVFSLLGAASIGLFIAPLAAVAIWLVLRFGRAGPEMLGMVSGAGVVSLLIALLNRGTRPCSEEGLRLRPGETEATCGGLDAVLWLVAGLSARRGRGRRVRSGAPKHPLGRRRPASTAPDGG